VEVRYIDTHYQSALRRRWADGFIPFLHFGEFEEARRDPGPVTEAAWEHAQRVLADRVVALARLPHDADVLEVGCGFGGNIAVIDATRAARRIVGLDIGPRQLELAARLIRCQGPATPEWVRGDAVRLPFTDGTFDALLAVECAFHFASRRRFAVEAARVLRPGGRLVLTDIVGQPAPESGAWPPDVRAMADVVQADMGPFPDPFGDEGTWATIADTAGLRVLAQDDMTAAVMPSFDYMLPDGVRHPAQRNDANSRSAAALCVAMSAGFMRMERWLLERP
jgi:ubiquinone/menaquinone biosynthesis C-methylase UbiE